MDNFTRYMDNNIIRQQHGQRVTKPLELSSGLVVSVQASEGHYCEPRKTLSTYANYESYEVGFPSKELPCEFIQYAEDATHPTETVYCCVPKHLIEQLVEEHGGIA